MKIKPEQIPDEAVETACAALAVAMEFGDTWPGDYAEEQQNELRQAMRLSLAAALPALLGEPVAFINKRELKWIPRWGGPGSAVLSNKQTGKLVALYTLPTQDTPNADQ